MSNLKLGAWLTVGHPEVAEAMASTGLYQWIAVDYEHASPSIDQLVAIFSVCEKYNVKPFVRILGHDPYFSRKVLDLGAAGLIIPVVENLDSFKEYLSHLHYAPKGRRGFCLSRVNKWGDEFNSYIEDFDPVIIPQIESVAGVKNLSHILELDGVSGVFVGPYDLSGDLGIPGQFENELLLKNLEEIKEKTKKSNKLLGLHIVEPDPKVLDEKLAEGYNFIAFGTDLICLRRSIKQAQKTIEGKYE